MLHPPISTYPWAPPAQSELTNLKHEFEWNSFGWRLGGAARLGRHPFMGEPGEAGVQNGSDDGTNDRAVRNSHASLKLPVATIGPSARAGLKGAPVRAPPIRMLKVSVIPIASGARLPARPATAVLSTTVTRKKASKASIMKPASGVIVRS